MCVSVYVRARASVQGRQLPLARPCGEPSFQERLWKTSQLSSEGVGGPRDAHPPRRSGCPAPCASASAGCTLSPRKASRLGSRYKPPGPAAPLGEALGVMERKRRSWAPGSGSSLSTPLPTENWILKCEGCAARCARACVRVCARVCRMHVFTTYLNRLVTQNRIKSAAVARDETEHLSVFGWVSPSIRWPRQRS